jgi:hypothetical protein
MKYFLLIILKSDIWRKYSCICQTKMLAKRAGFTVYDRKEAVLHFLQLVLFFLEYCTFSGTPSPYFRCVVTLISKCQFQHFSLSNIKLSPPGHPFNAKIGSGESLTNGHKHRDGPYCRKLFFTILLWWFFLMKTTCRLSVLVQAAFSKCWSVQHVRIFSNFNSVNFILPFDSQALMLYIYPTTFLTSRSPLKICRHENIFTEYVDSLNSESQYYVLLFSSS